MSSIVEVAGGAPGAEETEPPKTMLFDLTTDPSQERPFRSPEVERRPCAEIVKHLERYDAPTEVYERHGLSKER